VDRRRSGDGVQTGSSDETEPRDVGKTASRTLDDCCSSRSNYDWSDSGGSDSGKTLLVGIGERGISRRVEKGGKDGMLNLPISWNS
jgi:hypothetical protein